MELKKRIETQKAEFCEEKSTLEKTVSLLEKTKTSLEADLGCKIKEVEELKTNVASASSASIQIEEDLKKIIDEHKKELLSEKEAKARVRK